MKTFDQELDDILNNLLTNTSRYNDWHTKGKQALKEAIETYLIGPDSVHGNGQNTAWEAGIDWRNQLRSEQRLALWGKEGEENGR